MITESINTSYVKIPHVGFKLFIHVDDNNSDGLAHMHEVIKNRTEEDIIPINDQEIDSVYYYHGGLYFSEPNKEGFQLYTGRWWDHFDTYKECEHELDTL